MTAFQVIVEIVKAIPEISSVYFSIYEPVKHLKDILPDRILRHNPPKETIAVNRKEILGGCLDTLLNSLSSEAECLAFTSTLKIRRTRQIFYIPLMDFKCKICDENLVKIKDFLIKIGQKDGAILNSGESYHYYEAKLLSEREWLVFLGYCLLFDYTDFHYIGHQLIDGCTILRISKSSQHPKIPRVISILKAGR